MATVLTGDRPTGPLHLGHYAGSLKQRLSLQNEGHECFIMIADMQAYTDNIDNVAKVRAAIPELIADYLSVGINPAKTHIFLQSSVPQLAELTTLLMNYTSVSRLERNPTIKEEIKQRGFERDIPAGFLCYPVSQAADILAFKAQYVPVGDDQLPMIELAADLAGKINRVGGSDILPIPESLLSPVSRLPGIDGKAKASKSMGNAIFLSDDAETVKNKVMSMFTDPDHLRVSDPGKVEGNVVFSYLDAFNDDREKVSALKAHYQAGGLGDVALKKILIDTLETLLSPIRENRQNNKTHFADVLQIGALRAEAAAISTISEIKNALGIFNLKEYVDA